MNKLLSISDYSTLDIVQKKNYIKDQMNIQDLWVIGKVKIINSNDHIMTFIDFYINPYTGEKISPKIFTNNDKKVFIKCPHDSKEKLTHNSSVLVKFDLNKDKTNLVNKNIFFAYSKNIFNINLSDAANILSMIEVPNEEITPLALTYPNVYSLAMSQINVEKLFAKSNQLRLSILEENKKILLEKEEVEYRIELEKKELLLKQTEIDLQIEEKKKELKNINKKLNDYGFKLISEEKDSTSNTIEDVLPTSLESLINHLHFKLANQSLIFEKATLRRVVRSLKTEQMIILSGPSGTGKTTLVLELGNIINAHVEIIPVQPSWTDKQDLFGFYNPIQRMYVPSPFLDCLIRANENPNKLHIVCLDEMNLAQIEYYLADFLSLNETKSSQLRLYSEYEYEQNEREIKWYLTEYLDILNSSEQNVLKVNPTLHTDMISRHNNLQRYGDVIKIPDNIRIIGTMNVEGQVQSLSPKVTDRSYIIPLYKQRKILELPTVIDKKEHNIPASYFKIEDSKESALYNEINTALSDIKMLLKEIGIDYNARYEQHIIKYLNADLESNINSNIVLDDLILLKILPRIHDSISDPTFIDRLEQLVQECVDSNADSLIKLQLMRRGYSQTSLYSYWS